MPDRMLQGPRVLVVEDEFHLADHPLTAIGDEAAVFLGPASSVDRALDLTAREPNIDAAVLDMSLGGKMAFPAADLRLERGMPVVMTTGYDASRPDTYACPAAGNRSPWRR